MEFINKVVVYVYRLISRQLNKPWPVRMLCSIFTYHALEQCSKKLPIMLNIMPMSTAIMPQFVNDLLFLMTRLAQLGSS